MSGMKRILLGVGLVAGLGGVASASKVTWPNFPADATCTPVISNSVFKLGTKPDANASARMKALYDADQAERKGTIDSSIIPRDLDRRKAALKLLEGGNLFTGADLLGAAFVFQHGNCPNHYLLAHILAEQALKRGSVDAKFIYAATYDRWLISTGKPQKYGTQMPGFRIDSDAKNKITSCEIIEPTIDSTTKDSERILYGLPTLAQREKNAVKLRQEYAKQCPGIKIKDIKQ
jgi:hypothetical protein